MVLQKVWNQTDPQDANKLALTTKIEVIESAFSTYFSDTKPFKNNEKKGGPWKLEEWKITNVGPSIERDRNTLYWCPHHTSPQKAWPGMYMPYKPEDHDK